SNTATTLQRTDALGDIIIDQTASGTGSSNLVDVFQNSSTFASSANITQDAISSGTNSATVSQNGWFDQVTISQSADGSGSANTATISQNMTGGSNSSASVTQTATNGGNNQATIAQVLGSNTSATIQQTANAAGDPNIASISQSNSDHVASITQTGTGNEASITQLDGPANDASISQNGIGN
ncbi:hypothetical protein P1X15_32480, partial [Runella sp. MFBS21]|nr:hypothetical protein [Runella sp. MFBS21]